MSLMCCVAASPLAVSREGKRKGRLGEGGRAEDATPLTVFSDRKREGRGRRDGEGRKMHHH